MTFRTAVNTPGELRNNAILFFPGPRRHPLPPATRNARPQVTGPGRALEGRYSSLRMAVRTSAVAETGSASTHNWSITAR
ncbi:hypothetical protein EDD29_6540 [Actinocorallia herbida]|uniref:Uncharacterized protein n=1 Tax=Actinocorallia herbida TaxID=58109 RepID=A0A3N1D5X6_9ACTN|nr:hypothetical protein EDD29_6540 [Actinocorallia herbida]